MKVKLNDVCCLITDGEHGSVKDDPQGDFFLLSNKNIIDNGDIFISKNDRRIDKATFNKISKRVSLQKEDVLLSTVGTIGKSAIIKSEHINFTFQRSVGIIRPKLTVLNPYFLYYYFNLESIKKRLRFLSKGAIQKCLFINDIKNLELEIPSLQKQTLIAQPLQLIDNIINNNKREILLLESLIKTIYDYWFVQFDFPNEEGKPYKSSGGKMKWSDELKKEIPEKWSKGNLYKIADFINGLACQKYRAENADDFYNVIKIKEINNGINTDTEKCSKNIPDKYIINNGDLLFSWSASLIVKFWYDGIGALNQHIFKVIPKSESLTEYTYQVLNEYVSVFKTIANARKTTMGHITTDHISQSVIVIPDEEILNKFNSLADNFREKIKICHLENENLIKLKNFILPLLMNGQVKFKE